MFLPNGFYFPLERFVFAIVSCPWKSVLSCFLDYMVLKKKKYFCKDNVSLIINERENIRIYSEL